MKDYFSSPSVAVFDLAIFERLVADLSHVIILFPEAPGSFAEAGYFAQEDKFRVKTLLALDQQWQGEDSFISMGPAQRFSKKSSFRGVMQIAYAEPDFAQIVRRMNRYGIERKRKELTLDGFAALASTPYDLFCLLYKIIDMLVIATDEDVLFILRSLFGTGVRPKLVRELMSVLVGAQYIKPVGDFDHYRLSKKREDLMPVRESRKAEQNQIRLDLAAFYPTCSADFLAIMEASHAP